MHSSRGPGSDRGRGDRGIDDERERIRLSAGDAGLARRLLDKLLEELPCRRASIAHALARRDLAGIRSIAHTLAGGAAYCAVPALKAAAEALERAAASGDPGHTAAEFNRLEQAMEELMRRFPAGDGG